MSSGSRYASSSLAQVAAKQSPRACIVIVGLLLLFMGLVLGAARQKSPTADENFHLVAGYTYLKWADYRVNPEHPPLAKLLAALPLLTLATDDSPLSRAERDKVQFNGKYGWLLANQWLFSHNDAETLFARARLVMTLLGVALGILVFAWARELYGLVAGYAALVLYVFDPNILAYTPLIHTDIPFTLTLFGGTFFFWRSLREITWFNCLMTVLFFSASTITKFSFVTILPIWGLLGLLTIFSTAPLHSRITSNVTISGVWLRGGYVGVLLFSAGLGAYLAIWAAYGFRYDAVSEQQIPLGISSAVTPAWWLSPLIHLNQSHHVFPEAWLSGLVYALSSFNRTAYLLGEIAGDGFWNYFPIALAIKTPLPTLLLTLASLICVAVYRRALPGAKSLWVPIVVFLSMAIYSRMNIGLRHILPIYPFLFVWLGGTCSQVIHSSSMVKRWATWVLGLWLAWSCFHTYPDYLAFFNETLGNRERHEILVDSSLDWGQDLKGLKRWMVDQQVDKIELAYFGTADPAYYGINAIHKPGTWSIVTSQPSDRDRVQKARYIAISATHLVGLYFGSHNPYASFLLKEPVANIGHSIFIYRTDL